MFYLQKAWGFGAVMGGIHHIPKIKGNVILGVPKAPKHQSSNKYAIRLVVLAEPVTITIWDHTMLQVVVVAAMERQDRMGRIGATEVQIPMSVKVDFLPEVRS